MSSRWMRTGAWIFAGLVSGSFTACLIGPENAAGPCKEDAECDDGADCTQDTCAADGYCDHAVVAEPADDGEQCTDEVCTGDPETEHPARPDAAACGLDGMLQCKSGQCKCTTDAECGASSVCLSWSCSAGSCAASRAAAGTAVDGAEVQDCKKRVCDGAGNIVAVADTTDLPADPAGDCTKAGCDEEGNPTAVADDADVPADDQDLCTTEGCNGGIAINHEKVDDNTVCAPATCGGSDPSFQGSATSICLNGICTAPTPSPCGYFACNGDSSACRTDCTLDTECTSAAYCHKGQSTCLVKLETGSPCNDVDQCKSGQCVDGYCCNGGCEGQCEACNLPGKEGQCTIATGQQAGCPAGQLCSASGQCRRPNGDDCNNSDDCISGVCQSDGSDDPKICCNQACNGECRSCEAVKTGQPNGTCAYIKNKTDPDDECSGPCNPVDSNNCCNGGGVCNP